MTIDDYFALRDRLAAGQDISAELRQLHSKARETVRDGDDVFPWAECFTLALRKECEFPPLEASKALVDVALAADETMSIVSPYDGDIKRALSPAERSELFAYIAERIGENRSPQSYSAAADLADFLIDIGEGAIH